MEYANTQATTAPSSSSTSSSSTSSATATSATATSTSATGVNTNCQQQQHLQLQQHYKEQQQQHENQQQFCLRWHNHQSSLLSTLPVLLDQSHLTDVSIAAEGRTLRAHRVVLSACSTFFFELFRNLDSGHPVIIIPGASFAAIVALLTFMYSGEVNVYEEQIPLLLSLAETLGIKGLADLHNNQKSMKSIPRTDLLHTHLQRDVDTDMPPHTPRLRTPTPPLVQQQSTTTTVAPLQLPSLASHLALSHPFAGSPTAAATTTMTAASAAAPTTATGNHNPSSALNIHLPLLSATAHISSLHNPLAAHLLTSKLPTPIESLFLKSLQFYPALPPPPPPPINGPQPLNFSQTALNKTNELLAKYQQTCNYYQGALGSLAADLLPQLGTDDLMATTSDDRVSEAQATAAKRACVAEKKQQLQYHHHHHQQQQQQHSHHAQQQQHQQKDVKRLDRIVESLRCGNASAAMNSGSKFMTSSDSVFQHQQQQQQQHQQQQQQQHQQQQHQQQQLLAAYGSKSNAASLTYNAAIAAAQQRDGNKFGSCNMPINNNSSMSPVSTPATSAAATIPMGFGMKACGQQQNNCSFMSPDLDGEQHGSNRINAMVMSENVGKSTTSPPPPPPSSTMTTSHHSQTPDPSSRPESTFSASPSSSGKLPQMQSIVSPSPSPSPHQQQLPASSVAAALANTLGVTTTSATPTKTVSNSKLYATCFICHKQLSNQYNLRVHLETHQNVRYACNVCSHVSRSKDALRKHVSYRHPGAPSPCEQGRKRAASVAAKTLNAAAITAAAAVAASGSAPTGSSTSGPRTSTSPFPLTAGGTLVPLPENESTTGNGNEQSSTVDSEVLQQQLMAQLNSAAYMFMPSHFQMAAAAAVQQHQQQQQQQQQQQTLQNLVGVSQKIEYQQNVLKSLTSNEIKADPGIKNIATTSSSSSVCGNLDGIVADATDTDTLSLGGTVVCKAEPQSASNTSSIST